MNGAPVRTTFPTYWLGLAVTFRQFKVMLAIANHADRSTGWCNPGAHRLAEMTGVDVSHVRECLRQFQGPDFEGILEVRRRARRGFGELGSLEFRVIWPRATDSEQADSASCAGQSGPQDSTATGQSGPQDSPKQADSDRVTISNIQDHLSITIPTPPTPAVAGGAEMDRLLEAPEPAATPKPRRKPKAPKEPWTDRENAVVDAMEASYKRRFDGAPSAKWRDGQLELARKLLKARTPDEIVAAIGNAERDEWWSVGNRFVGLGPIFRTFERFAPRSRAIPIPLHRTVDGGKVGTVANPAKTPNDVREALRQRQQRQERAKAAGE